VTKRAEDFMDEWLDENVFPVHLTAPDRAAPALAEQCLSDAEKAGVSPEELEAAVVDVEEAITDELNVKATGQ
jgi:hypothetical protein